MIEERTDGREAVQQNLHASESGPLGKSEYPKKGRLPATGKTGLAVTRRGRRLERSSNRPLATLIKGFGKARRVPVAKANSLGPAICELRRHFCEDIGMRIKKTEILVGCVLLAAIASSAGATSVSFDLTVEFSGATPPVGSLSATFDDGGTAGSVELTMTSSLVGTEYVKVWLFNLDPTLDPAGLIFSALPKSGSFTDPGISTDSDNSTPPNLKADGDGLFDIKFTFTSGGGSDDTTRFGDSDIAKYDITGISTLTATSFDFLSLSSSQGLPTAAHVGGIGDDGIPSGWITVIPEPVTMVGVFLGLGGLAGYVRKRQLA